MTVKITIELDDNHRDYAEKMVKDGMFPSISSVAQAGIAQMIRRNAETDFERDIEAYALPEAEIRSRLELPRDQWIEWDGHQILASARKKWETSQSR